MRVLPTPLICLIASPLSAQTSARPMWFDLEPGPHAVGFQVRFVTDETRPFGSVDDAARYEGRPVRILVWYPAATASGNPMRYGDYLRIDTQDPRLRDYAESLGARDRDTARRQISPAFDSLRGIVEALPVVARRDAARAPGPFPLVLHSLGVNDYQLESTVLWEYLASHGYVVAVATPRRRAAPPTSTSRIGRCSVRSSESRTRAARTGGRATRACGST